MKKIFTLTLLLFTIASYAQGNLQFNQVLTYTGTIGPAAAVGSTYTVPVNKVWKVKSLSDFGLNSAGSINLEPMYRGIMVCVNNKWTFISTVKEAFFKAGDTIKLGFYDQMNKTTLAPYGSYDFFISIVEFNIIP